MIKQTDPQTGPVIAKFGCYLFSLLYKVEKRTGVVFDWPHIQAIYLAGIQAGVIGPETYGADGVPTGGCFVNDTPALLHLAGAGNATMESGPLDAEMFPVGLGLASGDEAIQE